ncbi:MAG: SLC13 family permease [Candidatus Nezhaarchaeota archaeon]|nr:SLC13 family permease [Candidatus Nezhaarchaeota archaeon]
MLLVFAALLAFSLAAMSLIRVESDFVGEKLIDEWLNHRGSEGLDVNSTPMILVQAVTLSLFLLVVVGTAMKMEWRVSLAVIGIVAVVFLAVATPQSFIHKAIEWNLILFLIGSMTLAGILRELGVFRFLAISMVKASKGSALTLVLLLVLLSFATAAVLDEVTSIIYVTILVFELTSLLEVDAKRLLVLSVLATNTGSLALPIGNPIGIYVFFTTEMSFSSYVERALPLALFELAILILLVLVIERGHIAELGRAIKERRGQLELFVNQYYKEVDERYAKRLRYGIILLAAFIALISTNELVSHALAEALHVDVNAHCLLAFIPYVFVALGILVVPAEEIPKHFEKSVEWPALIFFIGLFILGHSLMSSGVMIKLAYLFSQSVTLMLPLLLLSSTYLSAVLDNLSVVVAFTPVATLMHSIGLTSEIIYFAMLAGGVLGGNYTPIGSTANIVAVSIAERRGLYMSWRHWLKLSTITTTIQVLAALAFLYALQVLLPL